MKKEDLIKKIWSYNNPDHPRHIKYKEVCERAIQVIECCYSFALTNIDVFVPLQCSVIQIVVIISPKNVLEVIVDKSDNLSISFDTDNFNDLDIFLKMYTTIKINS